MIEFEIKYFTVQNTNLKDIKLTCPSCGTILYSFETMHCWNCGFDIPNLKCMYRDKQQKLKYHLCLKHKNNFSDIFG